MIEEINQPASAEEEQKSAPKLEEPTTEPTPASEQVEEWDKERAAATIKAQREKEKELKAQLKDYERLKAEEQKRIEAQMTEAEKAQKRADELAKQNAALMDAMLRRDIIAETGLPVEFADRLKGKTKEELLSDAEALKKLLPKNKAQVATTNPPNGSPNETDAQKRERLFGRQSNIFDIKAIDAMGGGVHWPDKKD